LQPAQLDRVHPLQLEPDEAAASDDDPFELPPVAKTENALRHSLPPQEGQATSSSSEHRTRISKRSSHAAQSYS
jgi:hypothetical protein